VTFVVFIQGLIYHQEPFRMRKLSGILALSIARRALGDL
jgi:hypothetical protein